MATTPVATLATAAAASTQPRGALAGAQSGIAAALISSTASGLAGSDIAQQVMQALTQAGAPIDVVDDAAFAAKYGDRTAGLFDPSTNRITLPARIANDPEQRNLVLLHEGVHWLQENVAGGAEALGGPIGQALQGAGAIRQTTPNSKADVQHDETQAYVVEAIVANQIGIRDPGLGTDSSGRALGYEQVLAKVQATPEYA